jgi:hypothetical protein
MSVKQVFNTSAELDYPTVLPTLDLDFANSKTLDPRITFTRASGGSYVGADGLIKYAGVNEARFDHDPVTGESLGLLIEESRSNLIEYSEDISNSNWINSVNITLNTLDTISPNGLNTATKLFDTTLESNQISQYRTLGSYLENNTYTFSIFVKPAERDKIRITLQNVSTTGNFIRAHINLSTGNIENSGAFGNATFSSSGIFKYPNGWYKIFITGTLGTTTTNVSINAYVQFPPFFPTLGSGGLRTGDGSSGIYLWGAQLEVGSFPTSYIPTVASTRTRAADSASITGKNFRDFYNQSEGTFVIKSKWFVKRPTGAINYAVVAKEGSITNSGVIGIWNWSGNDSFIVYVFDDFNNNSLTSEISEFDAKTTLIDMNTKAFAYRTDDCSFCVKGFILKSNKVKLPTKLDNLEIGRGISKSQHVFKLSYYPKRLPDSQLQALTS